MRLPKDVENLIRDYAASIEEYERRVELNNELRCRWFFRNLRRCYTIFLELNTLNF